MYAHFRNTDHGKEPQYLWQHINNVSELSKTFADQADLGKTGEVIGLLHDIGKASTRFQNYIQSAEGLIDPEDEEFIDAKENKGKIDHSSAGAQIAYRELFDKGGNESITAQVISLCIASHHSGLINCLDPNGNNNFIERMNKSDDKTHLSEILLSLSTSEKNHLFNKLTDEMVASQLINKLKSLREENDSTDTLTFKFGLLVRFLYSCLIDADRLDTANFEKPNDNLMRNHDQYVSWDELILRLDKKINEFNHKINQSVVNQIRGEISQICLEFSKNPKGIYQLTVPTGGGKTLASLRFALNHAACHHMQRILYIIPYTSIIDQNAEKVREILEDTDQDGNYPDSVVLEHHSNLTPEKESKKQKLLAENWDAPIIFTTQVQFLEALFGAGTRNARRMHQLANSVIIFDEVQTIPVRCVHLFNLALRFLVQGCGSTIVLCTATQPLLDKVEPQSRAIKIGSTQRIVKDEKKYYKELKRVVVNDCRKTGGWDEEETANLAIREMQQMGSALVIVNTRKSARSLFQIINNKGMNTIFHLSTNMCAAHRLDVLARIRELLNQKQPVICISTQLIEAGVDIDFGSVIRYLSGLDSIIQAAGRCNREGLHNHGNVWIINPADENLSKLRDIRIGIEISTRILDEYKDNPNFFENDPLGPIAMNEFYQYYFYRRKDEMKYNIGKDSIIERDDDLFNLLALNEISDKEFRRTKQNTPNIPLKQSFRSAAEAFRVIDYSGQGVIVPYGEEGKKIIRDLCGYFDISWQKRLLKKAQRYSVNFFLNEFKQMSECRAINEVQEGTGVYYLDHQYYSDQFGWNTEAVNPMELHIV